MKTNSLLSRKVRLAFGSAILALLVVGTISYRGMILSSESEGWVRHTHEVIENLGELLLRMQSARSNYRGFALTGQKFYIDSFRVNIAKAAQAETTVRNLTVDNPKQQLRLPTLEKLTSQEIQFGKTIIDLRRTAGLAASADAIESGSGQQIMDQIEGAVLEMQSEEMRLLKIRGERADQRVGQTRTILVFGTILAILMAVAAGWSAQQDHAGRALAECSLRESEVRFRAMANNISQLAWMADGKGSIFWYNDRWFDYTGTTLAEMAGSGWQKVHAKSCCAVPGSGRFQTHQ